MKSRHICSYLIGFAATCGGLCLVSFASSVYFTSIPREENLTTRGRPRVPWRVIDLLRRQIQADIADAQADIVVDADANEDGRQAIAAPPGGEFVNRAAAPRVSLHITCDNHVLGVYQETVPGNVARLRRLGLFHGGNYEWQNTGVYEVLAGIPVAIKCKNSKGDSPAGLLASFSNAKVSDSSWKCHRAGDNLWTTRDFDDSLWWNAREQGQNGVAPWGRQAHISEKAKWIWTLKTKKRRGRKEDRAYCRVQA